MRDNKRLLLCLCAVLILSAGLLTAVLLTRGGEEPASDPEGYAVVRTVAAADITGFIFDREDDTKEFRYTDRGWVYNSLEGFPLSADFMHSALETLSLIDAVEVVAEEVGDLSVYGLDTPWMRLSVTAGGTHSYLIGDYNSYNGFYYFMEEEGDTVFLIDADLPVLCRSVEADFVARGRLPDNFADGTVKRVRVDGASYTDGALLAEAGTVTLSEYHGYDENGLDGLFTLLIDYSAVTADTYGTAAYGIELGIKAEGEYLLFTYGEDGIVYRLEKAKYPELTKIIE